MHHKKGPLLTLRDWINREGVSTVAKLLNVEPATVRHWRRGHSLPRTEQMRLIKELSNGQVGYDQIIDADSSTNGVGK